ncbi:hypothetical protein KIMH_02680 [Bombiscardovia apis]|uniref:Sortase n=1 Tax=Bombiscardovia apis TaxID=2932182 RepID=A0ABM8BBB1_9BIFI|nr:class C sortase [Bombiscardovia apis]BDR54157.1 hypothetical protein KIMH_02680 [Bombiscardovia apis]
MRHKKPYLRKTRKVHKANPAPVLKQSRKAHKLRESCLLRMAHAAYPGKHTQKGHLGTKILGALAIVSLIMGYAFWSYSVVSKQVTSLNHQSVSVTYGESIRGKSQAQLNDYKRTIDDYNHSLNTQQVKDPFVYDTYAVPKGYKHIESLVQTPVMGQIEVPSIKLNEPIYFGRGKPSPGKGVEHVASTSIPDDVTNTNAVLAGHSGLTDSVVFDKLDQVKEGDTIHVQILNREFTYRVDRTDLVNPNQVEVLKAHQGQAQVTLLTCWPRFVNDKRLIVQGSLISATIINPTFNQVRKTVDHRMYLLVITTLILLGSALGYMTKQLDQVTRSRRKSGLQLLVAYLVVAAILCIFEAWVLRGLLLGDHYLPGPDLGYSWFNTHLFRLFAV